MAITYTNIIQDNVIDSLHTLLSDEFPVPIKYDEHTGNQSFFIVPADDSLVEIINEGQSRGYNVTISYQLKTGGNYTINNFKQVSNIAERVKRLILNNSAYSPSSAYKFHNGNISSIEYERDEDDATILRSLITFNCIVLEVV